MHRVAITGVGIISCLGLDRETVGRSLRQGVSGVGIDALRRELGFLSPLTGIISGFDPARYLNKKQRKTMPDFGVWAYAAVFDALEQAGLAPEEIKNEQTGLLFGCDSSCIAAIEQSEAVRRSGGTESIGSGLVFRSMTSTVTMNLNTLLGCRGACWTVASACSSGGHAIGQAMDLIALGRQERVICGGAQEINWESMCSFDGLGAFSRRVEEPAAASRPFDAGRDGLVPSGGAAALVLERYDLARSRGAVILGEILAYAFSSDGDHISVPSRDGLARAMRQALDRAGLAPGDVDYLSAHATSTQAGDAAEAANIRALFGVRTPPVSSFKSMTGHELWMSGASQAVYTIIMAQGRFIAPNINFCCADPATAGLDIVTATREGAPENVLLNAAGFGGTNSCLVLRFS